MGRLKTTSHTRARWRPKRASGTSSSTEALGYSCMRGMCGSSPHNNSDINSDVQPKLQTRVHAFRRRQPPRTYACTASALAASSAASMRNERAWMDRRCVSSSAITAGVLTAVPVRGRTTMVAARSCAAVTRSSSGCMASKRTPCNWWNLSTMAAAGAATARTAARIPLDFLWVYSRHRRPKVPNLGVRS